MLKFREESQNFFKETPIFFTVTQMGFRSHRKVNLIEFNSAHMSACLSCLEAVAIFSLRLR